MSTRLSAEGRRAEILDATVELIIERGLAAVRVDDVAEACGISRALVFYHFDTKEALVAHAFMRAAQRDLEHLPEVLSGAKTAAARLGRVVRQYGRTGDSPSWKLWIEAWAAGLHEPEIQAASRTLDKRWRRVLVDVINDGVATGEFTCPDPVASAWRITALIDGLTVQSVVSPHAPGSTRMSRWIRDATAAEVGVDSAALRPR
ncbi:MAG: TetR/AcrR family transcriptional regulator [Candidatus Nanopelagicales bacterium]